MNVIELMQRLQEVLNQIDENKLPYEDMCKLMYCRGLLYGHFYRAERGES